MKIGSHRAVAALALGLGVAIAIVVVLSSESSGPANAGGGATQPAGATTVQSRDLVETDTESGTLSYAGAQTVYDRLTGTITWLPSVGQVIRPGQALFEVDGNPVILMRGRTPAYRDLGPSDGAGQDILQLNRDLVALGFNPEGIVTTDEWQAATTAAVDVLQASLGETETGTLSLGQVVFLPGEQRVSGVDATLGSSGGGSAGASPGSNASTRPFASRAQFVSLAIRDPRPRCKHRRPKPHPRHRRSGPASSQTLRALIALLRAEIAELKSGTAHPAGGAAASHGGSPAASGGGRSTSPASGTAGSAPSPPTGGTASAILQTTSTQLVITVELDASKLSEAKVGEAVTVEMPNGSTVDGRIAFVSPVAQASSSGSGGASPGSGGSGNNGSGSSAATIPVTIALSRRPAGAGLDQAAVSVSFAQAVATQVLSVPVTALLATSGGGYAVQEASSPHQLVPVTTGLFAAGYVQISGSGIYSGLQVTDSQG